MEGILPLGGYASHLRRPGRMDSAPSARHPSETLETGTTIYRELRIRGLSKDAAAQVAGNCRRWWKNSAKLINLAFPIRYFDQLGIPRLAA